VSRTPTATWSPRLTRSPSPDAERLRGRHDDVTATGGVANFTNLPIDAAGSYTITATDGAHTAWTATTSSFTVIAAAPSKIAITNQPATSVTAAPALR